MTEVHTEVKERSGDERRGDEISVVAHWQASTYTGRENETVNRR